MQTHTHSYLSNSLSTHMHLAEYTYTFDRQMRQITRDEKQQKKSVSDGMSTHEQQRLLTLYMYIQMRLISYHTNNDNKNNIISVNKISIDNLQNNSN